MRSIAKIAAVLVSSLLLFGIIITGATGLAGVTDSSAPTVIPPLPLDESGVIDFSGLTILAATINAANVDLFVEPDGDPAFRITQAGVVAYVIDGSDPAWYFVAVKFDDYVVTGYIRSDAVTVAPIAAFEDITQMESFALAVNKAYDVSALDADQTPDSAFPGLYTAITNARPVYIARTGAKYHYNPKCSNMKNPFETSLSQALLMSREPCSKCVK